MKLQTAELANNSAIYTNRILDSVINRVKNDVKFNYDVELTTDQQTEIYNFLCQLVDERTRVCFVKHIPEGEYISKSFDVNAKVMTLAYGKNKKEEDIFYPKVLLVCVTKKEWTRLDKLSFFWKARHLPLFEEVQKVVDMSKPIEIVVFERASAWNIHRKSETGKVTFIGQAPHMETGAFVPSKPIGYVVGQKVVLTNPNERIVGGQAYYTFK